MSEESGEKRPFDVFELAVATLLGLAALGAAWSGFQSGLWGGKMAEAYSEASKMTTEASALNSDMLVEMSHDMAVDVRAKELIAEGRDASNETDRSRDYELASYMYLYQMSEDAYKSLGLPPELLDKVNKEPAEGEEVEDIMIPEDKLMDAYYTELDDVYYDKKFKDVEDMFEDADGRFEEGRQANDMGDRFDLAGVIYTVSLFFAGLSLVFKTKARWAFYAIGLLIFLGSSGYVLTLQSA